MARIRAELEALSQEPSAEITLSREASQADLDATMRAEAEAESAKRKAEAELEQIRSEAQQKRADFIRIESRAEALRLEHDNKVRDIVAAREEAPDSKLEADSRASQSALAAARSAQAVAEARRDQADPERVRLELERAVGALKQAKLERENLQRDIHDLRIRLEVKGGDGLGEAAERGRALVERRIADLNRLEAEAEALDLLDTVLSEAESRAKEAFLEPILFRIAPFLRLVIPDARLRLQDDLEIAGVERDGRLEPYAQLSVGTREQLSVLVRLAFAVYLREKGVPSMVILDDTLVFSDPERFDRMHLALRRAAETVQILVLTCRAHDWRSLGGACPRPSRPSAPDGAPATRRYCFRFSRDFQHSRRTATKGFR